MSRSSTSVHSETTIFAMKNADSQRVHSKTKSETSRKPLFFLGKPLHVHLHQGGNRSETTIFYNEKRGFPVWGIYYSFIPGRETSGLLRQRRPVGDHHWPSVFFSIINRVRLNRECSFWPSTSSATGGRLAGWLAGWLAGLLLAGWLSGCWLAGRLLAVGC